MHSIPQSLTTIVQCSSTNEATLDNDEMNSEEEDIIDDTPSMVFRPLSLVSLNSIDSEDIAITEEKSDEDLLFEVHGYQKTDILSDTTQDKLFLAEIQNDKKSIGTKPQFVTIKKREKKQVNLDRNIVKEAIILKHLTADNFPIGHHIIRYIKFFESKDAYYLVTEFNESQKNLKDFISLAFKHVKQLSLKYQHYQEIIKQIFWQLVVTVRWLHRDMNC